jgi:CubicO group peptidase (beta-lactamase class C family)
MTATETSSPPSGTPDVWIAPDAVPINGTCEGRFDNVREVFTHQLLQGLDIGASFAVFIDGQPVIDLWGGFSDPGFTAPWRRHNIVNVFSSSKTVTALCALVLADRGELDLDAPVAKYWPEFAVNGKADVLVRHIVSHTSGLSGWAERVTLQNVYDWEKSTALLARQAPFWAPGTASGYHGMTMGHLVGEVVRRVTGMSMGTWLQKELAGPLGANVHLGTWGESDSLVAPLIQGAPRGRPTGSLDFIDLTLFNPFYTVADVNTVEWRRAEIGAANVHADAHGLAALQSVLACSGEGGGKRFMSAAGARRVLDVQSDGIDLIFGLPVRWGLGYALGSDILLPGIPGDAIAFWMGNGGSLSFVDMDRRMSVAFTQNRWIDGRHENDRRFALLKAVYEALDA